MKYLSVLLFSLAISLTALEARALPIYESQKQIGFTYYTVKKGDTFYNLFKGKWKIVARFNRMDEKHLLIGERIKVPNNLERMMDYSPMPQRLDRVVEEKLYVLVDLKEQFLGVYEHGDLKFSAPISSADQGCCYTPTGKFRVMAFHRDHSSSIYKDAVSGESIPMPFAALFYLELTPKGKIGYWIHGGDLPGYPASHGCIRVTVEDARMIYNLLGGKSDNGEMIWVKDGAVVEIANNPVIYGRQGDVLFIEIALNDLSGLSARLEKYNFKREATLISKNGKKYAIVPVDLYENPGNYFLRVYDPQSFGLVFEKTVIVGEGVFPKHISKGWNSRPFTKEELFRIAREKSMLASGYDFPLVEPLWPDSLEYPIEKTAQTGQVTHGFGEVRINPKNGWKRFHRGVDIRAPEGFPIRAFANGKVVFIGRDFFLEGNITVIDHGTGLFSLYMHQSKILVQRGEMISSGQVIGEVGQTGNANGPHLHFSLRFNGALIDPIKFMEKIKNLD